MLMSDWSVIITGASRGLGRATALALARLGATLILNARSASELTQLREEIVSAGGRAEILAADISQPDTAERLVAAAVLHFGGLDAVINNAGVLAPLARIEDSDPRLWRRNLIVNAWAPFALVQAALPHLRRARHGRVINVSSGAAVRPTPGWSAYCASKTALNMFTGVLAAEEPDLTAVALRPGVIDTSMQRALREHGAGAMSPEQYQDFVQRYRQGQLLPPELPARVLAALALHAPHEWSGRFIRWDDPEVQELVAETFA
jgi:NAD(P)-dependent dehydrogenase (short-subunit alcohol dehydrogenase family)